MAASKEEFLSGCSAQAGCLMCIWRCLFWGQLPAHRHFPLLIFFSPTYWAVNSLMHQWSYCSLKLISWADAKGNNGPGIKRTLVIHRQKSLQQVFVVHWVFILFQINMQTSSTRRRAAQWGKGTSNYEGLIAKCYRGDPLHEIFHTEQNLQHSNGCKCKSISSSCHHSLNWQNENSLPTAWTSPCDMGS